MTRIAGVKNTSLTIQNRKHRGRVTEVLKIVKHTAVFTRFLPSKLKSDVGDEEKSKQTGNKILERTASTTEGVLPTMGTDSCINNNDNTPPGQRAIPVKDSVECERLPRD